MATWREFSEAAPELAAAVKARFSVDKHAVLATLRADGSPRVSGIETVFDDELWLGGMPGARKSADLRRDSRFALHSFTSGKVMKPDEGGDAKIAGRAIEVSKEEKEAYVRRAAERGDDYVPTDLDFDLFRVDITEAVTISVTNDELIVESWHPGQEVRRQARK